MLYEVITNEVWRRQIRPLAVGAMIVAAFYTLYNLRTSLVTGIGKALGNIGVSSGSAGDRLDVDLDLKKIFIAIAVGAIATFFLYLHFSSYNFV